MNYPKLTAWLVAAWFTFSLSASALHLFQADPNGPPLTLLLSVLVPITVFSLWYLRSKPFRDFTLSLNPKTLTLIHAWRLGPGFAFVVLYTYHVLPGAFALPAGWGDIAIGATALYAGTQLANPKHKGSFIVWQLLGMTDFVVALASGPTARFLSPQDFLAGITTSPLTMLPLSLIPTFGVPFLAILHIISIAQARRWTVAHESQVGKPARSFAA